MHKSVLLQETIDGLDIKKGDTIVDSTLNGGGHSKAILDRYGKGVKVIGLDADQDAIAKANESIGAHKNFTAICVNFRDLDKALAREEVNEAQEFIFDLGFSSDQLESSGRGFSFQKDEPLLMTFDAKPGADAVTAEMIVNNWAEENIALIIKAYGEESFAKRIAKAITEARSDQKIKTTAELRQIIEQSVPAWYRKRKIHPATKTFQSIRIAVNDEIEALKTGLEKAWRQLSLGGRIAVISFHSIEDRTMKLWIKEKVRQGCAKAITKKPITPGEEELRNNPRSRSAKLRIVEKI